MKHIFLVFKGLAVGGANVVPGISGATLAIIFGIYDSLIEAINNLTKSPKKSLGFLIPFGIGMVLGILALGSVIRFFFDRFSFQTVTFIAGLVAGYIPAIHRKACEEGHRHYLAAVVGAAAVIGLALVAPEQSADGGAAFTMGFAVLLFFGGLIAAATMVIPGISGSFVMVLLGLYPMMLDTIALIGDFLRTPTDVSLLAPILRVVVPIGLGMIPGILLVSKLIAFLLEKHTSRTYFVILGLMMGTIFALFNDPMTYQSHDGLSLFIVVTGVGTFLVGVVAQKFLGKQH